MRTPSQPRRRWISTSNNCLMHRHVFAISRRSFSAVAIGYGRKRSRIRLQRNWKATPNRSTNLLQQKFFSFGGATFGALARFVAGAVVMTIALYFFLLDGDSMIKGFMFLSPLDDRHEAELLDEFGASQSRGCAWRPCCLRSRRDCWRGSGSTSPVLNRSFC